MKYLYFLFLLILTLQSCKTFSFSTLPLEHESSKKIPPLEPSFDLKSFGPDYADLYNIPGQILNRNISLTGVVNYTTESFKRAEDTKRIYQSMIINNVSKRVGSTKGIAVCRRGLRSKGVQSHLNPILSSITLFIPNLFGYKFATFQDELEIIVDIYNMEDEVIASYSAMGYGKADVRMYKGYTVNDAKRLAHAKAFTDALIKIQKDIQGDADELSQFLQ